MIHESVQKILTKNLLREIVNRQLTIADLQEIRIRVNRPAIIVCANKEIILNTVAGNAELQEIMAYVSNYSLYAYENELRQGFLTTEGGHRVGIAGQVQVQNGEVKNMKNISSINIRISHEVKNCADAVFPFITEKKEVCHTLIVSPPRCGKTTLLRDLVRQISNGNSCVKSCDVAVVDERSEIAGCHKGIPQNDVGIRTDVLDGCPKKEGMLMLIRSMAPAVMAVDEIGAPEEVEAMKYAMNCGVKMLATVHGRNMQELRQKPMFDQLIKEHCFERYVVLKNDKHVGEVAAIFNERGSLLYEETK